MSEQTSENSALTVRIADLEAQADGDTICQLLNHYAQHPMGQGKDLPVDVLDRLISGMRSHPTSLVFLAERAGKAVGMATCFVGFSTFRARQLINIHDLVVHESQRGKGVGSALIDAVESHAIQEGFCAVTLEVLADNPARKLYQKKGFEGIEAVNPGESMYFGKKSL